MSNKKKNREWDVYYNDGVTSIGTMKCTACQRGIVKGEFFRVASNHHRFEFTGFSVQHHRCSQQWDGWKMYEQRLRDQLKEIDDFLTEAERFMDTYGDLLEQATNIICESVDEQREYRVKIQRDLETFANECESGEDNTG